MKLLYSGLANASFQILREETIIYRRFMRARVIDTGLSEPHEKLFWPCVTKMNFGASHGHDEKRMLSTTSPT